MAQCSVCSVLCCLLIICSLSHPSLAGYNLDYMYDMCVANPSGRVLYLGQGGLSTYGVVRLTRANDYVTNLNCALRLSSPAGYSLHVEVVWVDIYTPYQSCTINPDYLRITSSGSSPTVDKFYCGHGIPYDNSLAASNGQVDVRFWSGNYVSGGDSGFELHYNVYRTGGNCSSSEYQCPADRSDWCIPSELACDNRDNCFDGAEDWDCGLSPGAITAIVLASLLATGCLAAAIFYFVKENKRKKTAAARPPQASTAPATTTTAAVHYTVGPPPTYTQPQYVYAQGTGAYPQPGGAVITVNQGVPYPPPTIYTSSGAPY